MDSLSPVRAPPIRGSHGNFKPEGPPNLRFGEFATLNVVGTPTATSRNRRVPLPNVGLGSNQSLNKPRVGHLKLKDNMFFETSKF